MPTCFVPTCMHSNRNAGEYLCQWRRFPRDELRRKRWIKMIRREDAEPDDHSFVCSCHFRDGDFEKEPTLFSWNDWGKNEFQFVSPEKKKRKSRVRESLPATFPDVEKNYPDGRPGFCRGVTTEPPFGPEVAVQTEHTFTPEFYEAELYYKQREIEELQKEMSKLKLRSFGYFVIDGNEKLCTHYTGIGLDAFRMIKDMCGLLPVKYYEDKPVKSLEFEDQLLMLLMKLRHNHTYEDLGVRFGVAKSTAFKIVQSLLPVLHAVVFQSLLQEIPSLRKNKESMPAAFQQKFTCCRMVLDCTEMRCEVPRNMAEQKLVWSAYKHYTSNKILLGVAPNGTVTYCSDMYPGSTSDKALVQHCGILNSFKAGDMILADKGFLIGDILPPGVSVNLPPFLVTPQFSEQDVLKTRNVARARVHIERANQRLKSYRILNLIPKSLFDRASMVVQCCAGLINFQRPLLRSMAEDFIPEIDEEDALNVEEAI